MLLLLLLLFFIGLFLGSFFLVLIDRLPKGISPFKGRSKCDYCSHTLSAIDLFPVLSFLSTGGRCRYCQKTLSIKYPLAELITGAIFALTPLLLQSSSNHSVTLSMLIFTLFVLSTFIIIFIFDYVYGLIPFVIVIPGCVIALLYHVVTTPERIMEYVIAALGAFLFFYAIHYFTRGRGMGFGDVVLAFYLGVLLGFPGTAIALYIAFLTGASVSLILIFIGRKKMKGGTIPFGPFLIFGAFLAFFWGNSMLSALLPILLNR